MASQSTKSGTKSKKGRATKTLDGDSHDPRLDWERRIGPDPRDPRCDSCPHEELRRNVNQYAAWWTCRECGIRIFYIPAKAATGKYRAAGLLPADVKRTPEPKSPTKTRTTSPLTTSPRGHSDTESGFQVVDLTKDVLVTAGASWEAFLPTPQMSETEPATRETSPTPSFGRRGRAVEGQAAARNVSPKPTRTSTPTQPSLLQEQTAPPSASGEESG